MAWKWLKPINILAVIAVLFIAVSTWLYLPKEQFMWSVLLIVLILLLTSYANVRKPIVDYIEARRKAKNMPVDIKSERKLRAINYGAMIAVLAIAVLSWVFLPREQFTWAVLLIIVILLFVCYINVRRIISDIS